MAVQRSSGTKPAADDSGDRVEPVAAPAPGRVRDDPDEASTYGFRSLADADPVEDNGPGALRPQRVDATTLLDEHGNSTFASRAQSNRQRAAKRVTGAQAENKSAGQPDRVEKL